LNRHALHVLLSLPRLVPALLRHVGAYAELAGVEAHHASRALARQLLLAAVALLAALIAMLLGAAWILIALWDTPYRSIAAGILFGVFALISAIAAVTAARSQTPQSSFAMVHKEWEKDRELLESLATELDDPGLASGQGAPTATPQREHEYL
jgi:uncharacterized membrane protein YqjE